MKQYFIYIAPLIFLILLFWVWNSFVNIYETGFEISPQKAFSDGHSIITISALPLNSFGKKALLRNVEAEYEIQEGIDIVKIIYFDKSKGIIKLQTMHKPGKVVIKAKAALSLFPSLLEINILPNIT